MKIKGTWKPTQEDMIFPEEEIKRAARTLVGKPVRVNFQGPPIGYVIDAEYVSGGLEYTLEVPELNAAYKIQYLEDNKVHGAVFTELSFTLSTRQRTEES